MSSLLSWKTLLTIRPSKDDIKISMVKLSGGILEAEPAGSRNVDKVEIPVGGMSWGRILRHKAVQPCNRYLLQQQDGHQCRP